MHDCAASFSRQNIVEILSFHLWGVYYGRSEGGARDGYAAHHLRALQSWPTNRSRTGAATGVDFTMKLVMAFYYNNFWGFVTIYSITLGSNHPPNCS